jgi:hypothetical protein
VADVEKILRLVSEGALTPEEADEILAAIAARDENADEPLPDARPPVEAGSPSAGGHHLRIQVTEGGRQVVNLRVPMNIYGWASSLLPGLPEEYADRIRGAISSGERGPILDINDDGSRVLIVTE